MKRSFFNLFEEGYLNTRIRYIERVPEWDFYSYDNKQQDLRGTLVAMTYYTYDLEEKVCRLIVDAAIERVRQKVVPDIKEIETKEFIKLLSHEMLKELRHIERR